ncbi:hypothetical protein B0O80DRAFT_454908 [Mortierella sp. GBAus27b]|nr:hypothetical protein B0O80DRAFT_454908 [Mortierella sp. GBAus27b]
MLLRKCLLLLVSATVAFASADYDALVSGALFNGFDTTQPGHQALDTFTDPQNHPSAVASILLNLARKSEFTPKRSKGGVIRNGETYALFSRRTSAFPAFIQRFQRYVELDLKNGGINELIEQIEEHYEAQMAGTLQIAEAFKKLVPEYIDDDILVDQEESNHQVNMSPLPLLTRWFGRLRSHARDWLSRDRSSSSSSVWLLSNIVLYNEPGVAPSFEFCRIHLRLSRDPATGKSVIEPQKVLLEQTMYSVDSMYLELKAEYFAGYVETVEVNQFLDEVSTNAIELDEYDHVCFLSHLPLSSPKLLDFLSALQAPVSLTRSESGSLFHVVLSLYCGWFLIVMLAREK